MRIRSTKPEFWRSKRIASVSWDARLVLKGLESYVDDNGVGKDDIALIVSDVFPHDFARESPGTLGKVQNALSELSEAGLVWRYEADGDELLYVSWWEDIQYINKANKGRFRRPDGTTEYRQSRIGGSPPESPGIPGNPPVGTGEQGNRGTEQKRETAAEIAPPLVVIPDDWEPNLTHQAKAHTAGIDITAAAEAFRNHAIAQGRVLSNWDAGFSSWLANPKTLAADRERRTPNGKPQSKVRGLVEMAREARQNETQLKELS